MASFRGILNIQSLNELTPRTTIELRGFKGIFLTCNH